MLEWPGDLTQDFRDRVEKLQFGDEMTREMLNDYQNYARRYFPQLPAIVDAPIIETSTGGGYGDGRGAYSGGREGYGGGGYGEGGMGTGLLDEGQEDFICEWLKSRCGSRDADLPSAAILNPCVGDAGRPVGLQDPAERHSSHERGGGRHAPVERRGARDLCVGSRTSGRGYESRYRPDLYARLRRAQPRRNAWRSRRRDGRRRGRPRRKCVWRL